MQMTVVFALVIPVCFCFCLSLPVVSASLSPSGTWVLLWRDGDTFGRNAHNDWSIPLALVPGLGNLGANRITSRQPMSSGATTSAGRQKKAWGRCWESVVAMGLLQSRLSIQLLEKKTYASNEDHWNAHNGTNASQSEDRSNNNV